jgi:hypothetical protein
MAMNSTEVVQNLLAYTVVQDKGSLKSLLERNGVEMPSNCSDKEITIATLKASSKSPNFKNELVKLLSKNVRKAKTDFSSFVGDSNDFDFTGMEGFGFTGIDDFGANGTSTTSKPTSSTKKQARVSATNPQGKTQAGLFLQNLAKGIFSEDTINSGLNIGLTAINNKVAGRQNALQSEATVITQRQDEVRQTLSQPTKGSKTLTYVFVGVGILALIGVVYFVAKKKK